MGEAEESIIKGNRDDLEGEDAQAMPAESEWSPRNGTN